MALSPLVRATYRSRPTLRSEVAAAAAAYLAITLVLFRDLLPVIGTHLYGDLGDPLLNTATLAWNATVLPLTDAWWNFPSFAPLSGVTAWTEHLIGAYPLTTPIIWSTGNAVLAHNALLIACFPLNGICAFLLAREVTGSAAGAFVGGLAFAFAPVHAEHVTQVQLLMAFGMPLALYGLHVYLRTGARASLAWFAAGWASVLLSNAYFLVFFPLLLGLWNLWFLRGRLRRAWVDIGATAVLCVLPVIPLLWGYYARLTAYAFSRPYSELTRRSADVAGLTGISQRAVVWRDVLPNTFYEGAMFPGFCISILVILACVMRPRRFDDDPAPSVMRDVSASRQTTLFYFAAAIVMWSFTLGPQPQWAGVGSIAYGPYWLLLQLPGGQNIRVPPRGWIVAALCIAVCAGAGASWLAGRKRSWVVLPIAVAIVTEVWFRASAYEVPAPVENGLIPAGAVVLELPLYEGYQNTRAQYRAVLGGYRVVNGYSGYSAPHSEALRRALAAHRPEALNAFRRLGDLYLLIEPEVDRAFIDWLLSQHGIEPLPTTGAIRAYRLPGRAGPALPDSAAELIMQALPGERLRSGARLLPGQELTSTSGRYRLHYQTDGNVVLYDDTDRTALWNSATTSSRPGQAMMERDGNFVVYDGQGRVLWTTGTTGNPNAYLLVQDDGNLVVYRPDLQPMWDRLSATMVPASGRAPAPTVHRGPPP